MSGLENLQARLQYCGGKNQKNRLSLGKVNSLKKALLYSYQSATAILSDGREFRCLINKDKTKITGDDKIISIPFEDICLNEKEINKKTSKGIQKINMKPGDVFTWKETNTDWLVYLQKLEETAYFRAEIRNCRYSFSIDEKTYKVFARKKDLSDISWHKTKEISWNDLDYSLEMYITKDEITKDYFKRFDIIELDNKPWEVQAADAMSVEGIVMVALKEYYNNSIEKEIEKEKETINENTVLNNSAIKGPTIVYPYDLVTYAIENAKNGTWILDSKKAIIKEVNDKNNTVNIEIISSRSGSFKLKYIRENEEDIVLDITIGSL